MHATGILVYALVSKIVLDRTATRLENDYITVYLLHFDNGAIRYDNDRTATTTYAVDQIWTRACNLL